jgi:hypothetical protein
MNLSTSRRNILARAAAPYRHVDLARFSRAPNRPAVDRPAARPQAPGRAGATCPSRRDRGVRPEPCALGDRRHHQRARQAAAVATGAARVRGRKARADRFGALAANGRPILDQLLVCSSRDAHLGLGPETRRLDARTDLGPSEGNTRVLGEEVRPGERPQLGDGLVLVLNPAASAMPTADSRDLRGQDLVSRAHTCRPLQTRFDLDLGVPPGRILISRPRSRP